MGFADLHSATLRRDFLALLRNGQIALGDLRISINSTKTEILESLQDRLLGKPREWVADKSKWTKYTFTTDVLWYPIQPVLFTFRDDYLALIEFSENTEPHTGWDYSLAVEQYFRMKTEIVKHLDKESRGREANARSMEAVWDFANLSVYLACDGKSGGCGIGVRPLEVRTMGGWRRVKTKDRQVDLSDDPYGNEHFKEDVASGKLRWLFLILALANMALLISMALDSKEPILHFPVRLQGAVVLVWLSITLLALSILAVINWTSWLKRDK